MTDSVAEYTRRYHQHLVEIARRLERHISSHLDGCSNVDRVTARAKDPERFEEKSRRKNSDGSNKYENPLTEVQDQLGARIVLFYLGGVGPMTDVILRYFQPIEQKVLVPESEWEFGYFGKHLVLPVPRDVVPQEVDLEEVPRFFELQIKTLFQHAWSEANHDIGYKVRGGLTGDQERRLAFTAAQAWGADRVFDELVQELQS